MTKLGKFLIVNIRYVPDFVYNLFRGYFTRNLMKLVLGVQYSNLKLKSNPPKGKYLPDELLVVGYSASSVYFVHANMLCCTEWEYVKLPSLEEYRAILISVEKWVGSQEYVNIIQLLKWMDDARPYEKLQIKERDGTRVFERTVEAVRDRYFIKDMLGMKACIFMFVFTSFDYSYAYMPKDIELLVDKMPC